eukprot:2728359-Prymnesium_polylepis.1
MQSLNVVCYETNQANGPIAIHPKPCVRASRSEVKKSPRPVQFGADEQLLGARLPHGTGPGLSPGRVPERGYCTHAVPIAAR